MKVSESSKTKPRSEAAAGATISEASKASEPAEGSQ